jgi:hypothetical protein
MVHLVVIGDHLDLLVLGRRVGLGAPGGMGMDARANLGVATSGSWSSGAPWTTWTACTATTTATKTFTTTSSGAVIYSTSFGIQVAEQTGTSTGAVSTTSKPGAAYNNAAKMGLVMVIVSFVVIIQG